MAKPRLLKPQREMLDAITGEGARIVGLRKGGSHILVDYTWDGRQFFTTMLHYGTTSQTARNVMNFRAQIRRNKPTN